MPTEARKVAKLEGLRPAGVCGPRQEAADPVPQGLLPTGTESLGLSYQVSFKRSQEL